MATALEQLRYIDEQLATAVLPQDQAELVRVHRLTGLHLRTQRMQGNPNHRLQFFPQHCASNKLGRQEALQLSSNGSPLVASCSSSARATPKLIQIDAVFFSYMPGRPYLS